MGPQYLLHIGGFRETIKMVDLAVREYISERFGAAICHTYRVDTNGKVVFVFYPQKGRLPRQI